MFCKKKLLMEEVRTYYETPPAVTTDSIGWKSSTLWSRNVLISWCSRISPYPTCIWQQQEGKLLANARTVESLKGWPCSKGDIRQNFQQHSTSFSYRANFLPRGFFCCLLHCSAPFHHVSERPITCQKICPLLRSANFKSQIFLDTSVYSCKRRGK